jgi:class 3 adenylate cyclase
MNGRIHTATWSDNVAEPTTEEKPRRSAPGRLRFSPDLEPAFAEAHFVRSLRFIRLAIVLAIVLYAVFGVLDLFIVPDVARSVWIIRYAIFCPAAGAVLWLTFTPRFQSVAQPVLAGLAALCGLGIVAMVAIADPSASSLYYAGLLLVIPWAYSVLRLRFAYATAAAATILVGYEVMAIWVKHTPPDILVNNNFFFLSSVIVGVVAGYTIERGMRAEFLQRRLIDRERHRSDALLANILPLAIIDRLKDRGEGADERRVAEALDLVTVLFADAVGFTVQAEKTEADDLVAALDGLFSRFDDLADRYGLEKIKTVGDAYMAVAGAPEPHPDHAQAAAEMALAIIEELENARWPSGDPILVRIGIASGPAVAGVIGQRKFAYDLWGDTVNLASRLQSHGEPGRILVSESVVRHLEGRYKFGPRLVLDLKGKGPTPARLLLLRIRTDSLETIAPRTSEVGAAPLTNTGRWVPWRP